LTNYFSCLDDILCFVVIRMQAPGMECTPAKVTGTPNALEIYARTEEWKLTWIKPRVRA
jgi:hypothetical protein